MTEPKVGLVLSGGGAKGAYQVGVLKALVELDVRVHVIAGSSIGALNGAIIASSSSLQEGANRIEEVWLALAEQSPLHLKMPNFIYLLATLGAGLNGLEYISSMARIAQRFLKIDSPIWLNDCVQVTQILNEGLFSSTPLKRLLENYLTPDLLAVGMPLYISVYQSEGAFEDIMAIVKAELGFGDSNDSEFIHIQSLPKSQQQELLIASAAIPILFSQKQLGNFKYADGGIGGWGKMQGNTPITPLLEAGCNHVIVSHLSDGSLWTRQDFSDVTILEIRPQTPIARDGGIKDLLGFDSRKIPSWIEQGYQDTLVCVGRIMKAVHARIESRTSAQALSDNKNVLDSLNVGLAEAMKRLQ